jgi:hypothetical protein
MMRAATASYDALVKTGAIGSLKRDVLLEASRDLEYLGSIAARLADMGSAAKPEVIPNTVRPVEELVVAGFCQLATWGEDKQPKFLNASSDEITSLVERSVGQEPFIFFLWITDNGDEWVSRYDKLVSELSV